MFDSIVLIVIDELEDFDLRAQQKAWSRSEGVRASKLRNRRGPTTARLSLPLAVQSPNHIPMMSILRFFRRPKAPVPLARRPTESELHVSRILAEPRISPGVLTDLEIFNSTTGGDALSALAELKIRSAIREGLLDEIQGRGKPLAFFESPFVTPHDAAMNRIMIKNGAVPDWIGAGSLIEKEAGELRRRMRREWEARKRYADTFDGPWKNELANRVECELDPGLATFETVS